MWTFWKNIHAPLVMLESIILFQKRHRNRYRFHIFSLADIIRLDDILNGMTINV